MTDHVEVNYAVKERSCRNPHRRWTDACNETGRTHFINAPDPYTAARTVCILQLLAEIVGIHQK